MPKLEDILDPKANVSIENMTAARHAGSMAIINYKGGVGKTTISCLLGYYLAEQTNKKVLLIDIDPQCSLSLALGFNPDEVSKTDLTIYNLVIPSKWSRVTKTDFGKYAVRPKDTLAPKNLRIIRGAFDIDQLDIEIAQTLVKGEQQVEHLHLYCKQMLDYFEDEYEYVIIDCPPSKMFVTQAMLRACAYYIPVTIPDRISVYGMPRLLRWVREIEPSSKPKMLGYVLNALNRAGGGMVISQQASEQRLVKSIVSSLDLNEKAVLGDKAKLGELPRLDVIARFLSEEGYKWSRMEFKKHTSMQRTVDECLVELAEQVIERMEEYRAKT